MTRHPSVIYADIMLYKARSPDANLNSDLEQIASSEEPFWHNFGTFLIAQENFRVAEHYAMQEDYLRASSIFETDVELKLNTAFDYFSKNMSVTDETSLFYQNKLTPEQIMNACNLYSNMYVEWNLKTSESF